jgi:release factor glutamine methyltransferase
MRPATNSVLQSEYPTDKWQKKRQKAFKAVQEEGKTIRYLGKEFRVYPNTFWPFDDSKPLVKNFRVSPGDSVLDVGTGSGVIAIFSCYKGAGRVLAVDVNPAAIRSARHNAKMHGFSKIMEVRRSNVFEVVGDEQFDVITANLPFRNKPAPDVVARSQWDTDFATNIRFFQQVERHLKPDGRIYFSQADFGPIKDVRKLAKAAGLTMHKLATEQIEKPEPKTFYVFVMKRARRA